MNKIEKFVSKMNYLEDKEMYVLEDERVIGYGNKKRVLEFSQLDISTKPMTKLFISINDLMNLKQKQIHFIKIGCITIEIKYILKIPLNVFEIYVFNKYTPLCIKYFDYFFIIAAHFCDESCTHEIAELKSTIKIKKLSDY